MKKKISMVLITVMAMSLFTGCLREMKDSKKIKIGVCISSSNDQFLSNMLDEMRNYSKSLNDVEVVYADSKEDSNTQLQQVENFIDQGVDVLVINPVDTNSSNPITDKAKAAKVPIISFNKPFANQNDAACYVGSDSKQSGTLEMEYLANKMNFKGNVAIMMGKMGEEAQRSRTQAFHDVIAKYPEMKVVAEQTADWDRARGMTLMENWLKSGREIDVVASNNDEMAIGALKAIEVAGKLGKITVGGIDANPEGLDYLRSGKLAVTVFQNAIEQGQCTIETAVKVAKGEDVEKIINFQNELVVLEDADKYIAKWEK